ncbi:MAG: hypothetical protein AB1510_09685 [Bacillota bacterium]
MQKGFSKTESVFVALAVDAFFLVGAYAVVKLSFAAALVSVILVVYLWYYLHRPRICNFCDQNCPFRPRNRSERCTRAGFSGLEAAVFYPVFLLILVLYLAAVYRLNLIVGLILTVLVVYALVLYRIRICPNCNLPCPFNKKRHSAAG